MRRALSIVPAIALVLFFGLGPLFPLAGVGDDDASLPACCRRSGAHHCAMNAVIAHMMRSSAPSFDAPVTCPNYPGTIAAIISPAVALVAAHAAAPAMAAQEYQSAIRHIAVPSSLKRTHAGRGPPTQI